MNTQTKSTPWWHPAFPTPEGERYVAADRTDIAKLIRDKKREGNFYRSTDIHGRRVYTLTVERQISGRVVIG
jgi:hypothetical protein